MLYAGLFNRLQFELSKRKMHMAQYEMIDIIDANGKIIGKEEKLKAHLDGLWHRSFHCWILHQGKIVLQWRAKAKASQGDKLETSAAGHITVGEDISVGGVREIEEELGLKVKCSDLHYAGIQVLVGDEQTCNGLYKHREHAHVYFLKDTTPLASYKLQDEELDGIYMIHPSDLIRLFSREVDAVSVEGYSFIDAKMNPCSKQVTQANFVPHTPQYYIKIAIMAERLLEGKPIAV